MKKDKQIYNFMFYWKENWLNWEEKKIILLINNKIK